MGGRKVFVFVLAVTMLFEIEADWQFGLQILDVGITENTHDAVITDGCPSDVVREIQH